MTPAFITLNRAPASAPSPIVFATRRIVSVVPRDPPKWEEPSHIGRNRPFDVGGTCYYPPRVSYNRDWTERRDVAPGEPAAPEVRVPDIAPIFACYLDENRVRLKAEHDDINAGAAVVVFDDGATVVVLESFEHVARLLGSVQ